MKHQGIQIRLLIAAFIMVSAAMSAFNVVGLYITGEFMHKRFEGRITFLAKYLAENSEVGVLLGDRTGLKSLAHNLLGEEDVAKVVIFDNDGKKLVDLSKDVQGSLSSVETPVVFRKSQEENILYSYMNTPLGPMKLNAVENIGKVRIDYTTKGIDLLMSEINRKFILVAAGLVVLAGGVFFFLSRSIVEDVTQLVVTAQQVGRGDFELRATPGKLPETRALANAFNMMLDSLFASRKALEKVNREVSHHKAIAERGKFSLMVAHEVKNPLGIIKSSLDVLKKDQMISDDNLMITYMEDEISRLNRLIEDFLMFAKPAEPLFRMVDFNRLLINIADRFELQSIGNNRIVRNIPDVLCESYADMDLLTRAISNIVKNACEASGENGEVIISSSFEDDIWVAEIADKGEGINDDNLPNLFEPFFTTRSKGTGLGLAFAHQVVAAHEGTIEAQNSEEGGAVFTVTIPLKLTA